MAIRRGPPVWPHITFVPPPKHRRHEEELRHCDTNSDDDMRDLRCMSFTSKATSEILVAGLQDTMFVIDVNKGEIVKRVWHVPPRSSGYLDRNWRLNRTA